MTAAGADRVECGPAHAVTTATWFVLATGDADKRALPHNRHCCQTDRADRRARGCGREGGFDAAAGGYEMKAPSVGTGRRTPGSVIGAVEKRRRNRVVGWRYGEGSKDVYRDWA